MLLFATHTIRMSLLIFDIYRIGGVYRCSRSRQRQQVTIVCECCDLEGMESHDVKD